jgi:nucleotide-binding universal stress UspA family protein
MSTNADFTSILVPTDGSEYSVAAGKLAIDMAAFYHARLTFIYVVDEAMTEELARASQKTSQEVRKELADNGQRYLDYLAKLAQRRGLAAEKVLREGTPHIEIVNEARKQAADLIVMGQVGRRGPRRILIGSVAERVIEYAECPVLITKKER